MEQVKPKVLATAYVAAQTAPAAAQAESNGPIWVTPGVRHNPEAVKENDAPEQPAPAPRKGLF